MHSLALALLLLGSSDAPVAADLRVALPSAQSGASVSALELDLLTAFARLTRTQVKRVETPDAAAAARAVEQGRADVLVSTGAHDQAAGLVWSDDVVPTRFVVVNRRPAAPLAYLEELRGRRVAVAGEVGARVAAEAKIHVGDAVATPEALAALHSGSAEAVIVDMHEALTLQRTDPALQLGVFVGPRQAIRFAVRRGDPRLGALNAYLAQVRASSSWGMLLARHLGPSGMEALGRAKLSVR